MNVHNWEKTLWKAQPFADNYIPPHSFLSSLRKNPNFRPYTYWPLVLLSCAITQHLAIIFIFVSVFVRLKERTLDPRLLIFISIVCFATGLAIWEILDCTHRVSIRKDRMKIFKSSILTFLALLSLSPVLRTLTAATSSDSIWALAAFLFALNALFADYSSSYNSGVVHERLTSVLSMNAAISASVVLASRLSDDLAVFALVLFSVQIFALFPLLRHHITGAPVVNIIIISLLSCLALLLAAPLSTAVTSIYLATMVFVTFLAPAVLVWAQKHKNEIRGPWDVAVPKVN